MEILSPSTRRIDLLLKRSRDESAGCLSYWVIDPDQPTIIAWELSDGVSAEAGRAVGGEELILAWPYPVTLRPVDLVC